MSAAACEGVRQVLDAYKDDARRIGRRQSNNEVYSPTALWRLFFANVLEFARALLPNGPADLTPSAYTAPAAGAAGAAGGP